MPKHDAVPMVQMTIRLPIDLKRAFMKACKRDKVQQSEAYRAAIAKYVASV